MTGKVALREIANSHLPSNVAALPKRGFRVPISSWFRGELHREVEQRLLDDSEVIEPYVTRDATERLLFEHKESVRDHSSRLWALLVLRAWLVGVTRSGKAEAPTPG